MTTAEGTVATDRPERYLTQLCRHATAMAHGPHGTAKVQVDCTPTRAVLRFGHSGQCVVEAGDSALSVRIEADDEASLTRIRDVIAADLARFGRRDQLAINWR